MASSQNVLIFGPTGGVGSAAALFARKRGATVWLAMRDTSKPISHLDSSDPGYHRVQADLTDPSSLAQAVKTSSARTAFVYCMFGIPDFMAQSFAALKSAGITFVVFLSSYTVQGAADDEKNMAGFLSKLHAQTEVALRDSGIAYAAVRPMFFSTNVLWNKDDMKAGKVGLLYPDVKLDYVTPSDIGAVCGAMLADPELQQLDLDGGAKAIYMCGPELLTQRRAHEIIAEALGREIVIQELDEEAWMTKHDFLPRPVLESTAGLMRKQQEDLFPRELVKEYVANVKKYAGREALKLGEWVKANRELFE
jgi:uncharacterized protein YbjT (DUF2867 family)